MSDNKSGGLGLSSVIQIVFIILKLCKLISWSWWVVLIPLWINLGLLVLIVIVEAITAGNW